MDFLLVVLGIAFFLQVSITLYKYSVNRKFILWGAGWTLFSLGGVSALFHLSLLTEPIDIIAIAALASASAMIQDASQAHTGSDQRIPFYMMGFCGGILLGFIGVAFAIPKLIVYTPVQFLLAYACFGSLITLRGMERGLGLAWTFAMIGFLVLGLSGLFYPLLVLSGISYLAAMVQAVGVITTGASLMGFYADLTTENLKAQYELSELMSMTLQHDIRGYVQTASLALEAHQVESDTSLRLMVASQAMEDAIKFCESMRDVSASLLRLEARHTPIRLVRMVESVMHRVQREYGLKGNRLAISLETDPLVYTNQLAEELFWNIVHNALKHGGSKVTIQSRDPIDRSHYISIIDDAGGMPSEVKEYLNSKDPSSTPEVPGSGLGLALIKGLAEVCGASLSVYDVLNESSLVGTEILLGFQLV
jgi:signal transduction histidine kinase